MGDTLLIQSWKDKIEDTQENGIRLADEIASSLSSPVLLKLFLSHRGRGIKAKNNAIDDTYADLRSSFVSLGRWGGGANATLREGGLRFATLLTPARDPGTQFTTQFTCFTSTIVQILTSEALLFLQACI